MSKTKHDGIERRRARRSEIQDSFNLYLVIPKVLSMARLYMKDISSLGICARNDLETGLKVGQTLETRLYFNPGFYLPLACKVMRVTEAELGLEFVDSESREAKAVVKLQEFIDCAEAAGVFTA